MPYRMGYDFYGWYIPEYDDQWGFDHVKDIETDYNGDDTHKKGDPYVFIAIWTPWYDYDLRANINYNDSTGESLSYVHEDGTGVYWYQDVTLPTVNASNSYGYVFKSDSKGDYVEADGKKYTFKGYVFEYARNDQPYFESSKDNKVYIAKDTDSYGPVPVVAPGTYTYQDLYYQVLGGLPFPAIRFDKTNVNYPYALNDPYAPKDPNSNATPFDNTMMLRAVFEERQETVQPSYIVHYYNTDGNGNADTTSVDKTYTNTSANADSYSSLGMSAPTDANYTYTFAGWATSANGSVIINDSAALSPLSPVTATPANEYSLYAIYNKTAKQFTVIYHANDGSSSVVSKAYDLANASTTNVLDNTDASLNFSNGTDTFDGWNTKADGSGTAVSTADIASGKKLDTLGASANGTIDLYAQWVANTYEITYDKNSGNFTGTVSNPYTVNVGATSVSAPAVNRTGYFFGGWADSQAHAASGTVAVKANGSVVAGSAPATAGRGAKITLYAIWTSRKYTVNWLKEWTSPNAAVSGQSKTTTNIDYATQGMNNLADPYGLKNTDTVTSGSTKYKFVGWYITKGNGDWNSPASGLVALSGNNTLQAALAIAGADATASTTAAAGTLNLFAIWTQVGQVSIVFNPNYPADTGKSGTATTVTVDQGSTFDFDNSSDAAQVPTYTVNGYYFDGWKDNTTSVVYKAGSTDHAISNITKQVRLFAQWKPNTVKFDLKPGAADTSIVLNGKTDPQAKVGDTVTESILTSATPTRTGHTFKGWSKTQNGSVIVSATASYPVIFSDAPSNPTTMDLYAVWEETKYTVVYYANATGSVSGATGMETTDGKGNTVYFYKGSTNVSSPYTYKTDAKFTDTGFDNPDLTKKIFGDATNSWYDFIGWSTTVAGRTPISGQNFQTLYGSQTDGVLELYAIWDAKTYTINYVDDGHGTVTNAKDTVNLATGDGIKGSTAQNPTTGYELAIPTWTDTSSNNVTGNDTTAKQATYKPSLAYVRSLSLNNTDFTFRANFTEASYDYEVQAYLMKADGTYDATPSITFTQPGGQKLQAKYGKSVAHTQALTSGTYLGKQLVDLALLQTTNGVKNSKLYTFESGNANNKLTITSIAAESTGALSNNIIKIYYERKTYDLTPEFKTSDGELTPTITTGAPSGFTQSATDFVNGGSTTTGIRWGASIPVTAPTYSGYTFAWAVTAPASATSTNPGTTFTLNEHDMGVLSDNNSKDVTLTGTFTVEHYTITLTDPSSDSTHNWVVGGVVNTTASQLQSAKKTQTSVAHDGTLGSWVPDADDNSTFTHYFVGWYVQGDVDPGTGKPNNTINSTTLGKLTNWTSDVTYVAYWAEKIVVSYDPGTPDHYGNSRATWTTKSISLKDYTEGTTLLKDTDGEFSKLVGTAYLDGNGNPLGAAGWEFDYWTVEGDVAGSALGHTAKYTVTSSSSATSAYPIFMEGATTADGVVLYQTAPTGYIKSYKFVAHWKGKPQTVAISATGNVHNNASQYTSKIDAQSYTDPNSGKTWVTGDVIDLATYTAAITPKDGYKVYKWTDGTNEYDPSTKIWIQDGGITLEPLYDELTATVKYGLDSASASPAKGSVSAPASEKIYVVKHNGVTEHTATSTNTAGYKFKQWTYNGTQAAATTDGKLTAKQIVDALVGALGGGNTVLTSGATYLFAAEFETKRYKLEFNADGTDNDSTNPTSFTGVVSVTGTGSNRTANNGYEVDWNTTLNSSTDTLQINTPLGYELAGWIVDGNTSVVNKWGVGPTAANLQGLYSYAVTGDHTLTAVFQASSAQKFTVNYNYDPNGVSGFNGSSELSRNVAWKENVLPKGTSTQTPAQNGFTFQGWYIDAAMSTAVSSTNGEFGTIYNWLKTNGATSPNIETTSGAEAITIYAKWEPIYYTVNYDTYGRDTSGTSLADDPSTTEDDPNWLSTGMTPTTKALAAKTGITGAVTWNTAASLLKYSSTYLTRPGYTLDHWYATYNPVTGGGTVESKSNVADSDKYHDLAGNDPLNIAITLHAVWRPNTYKVVYDFGDATINSGGTATPSITGTYGWTESRDYYDLPAGSTINPQNLHSGYVFGGWDVQYTGSNGSGSVTQKNGNPITASTVTTLKDLVKGDTVALQSDPVVTLVAKWTQQSWYRFQDVLVKRDGTYTLVTPSRARVTTTGNSYLDFDQYPGYNSGTATVTTTYDGYDFDNHAAVVSGFTWSTPNQLYIPEGADALGTNTGGNFADAGVFYVFFIERVYDIAFYNDGTNTAGTLDALTKDNPWDSAAIKVPATNPSRDGYDFVGWEISDGTVTTLVYDAQNGTTKKISDAFVTADINGNKAPAAGTTIKAIAKWSVKNVKITWRADANGSISADFANSTTAAGNGSVTLPANDTDPNKVPTTITATPNANYKFDGWYAIYTDGRGSHDERVDALSSVTPYATLDASDAAKLTPIQWNPKSSTGAKTWNEITFVARFVVSTSIPVTVHHYREDKVNGGFVEVLPSTTEYGQNGKKFTATPKTASDLPGYKYDQSVTGTHYTDTIDVTDSTTLTYALYYVALSHTLHYKFVQSDGTTPQPTADMPSDANTLPSADGSTYYTDVPFTVAAAPTTSDSSAWIFSGWFLSDDYNNVVQNGNKLTFKDKDITLVGTWKRVTKTVHFVDCVPTDSAYTDGCRVSEPNGGFTVNYGGTVADPVSPTGLTTPATKLSDINVSWVINGAHELTGWAVLKGGSPVLVGGKQLVIGKSDPLTYTIDADTTFRAVYSDTYAVTYTRGAHGTFKDSTGANTQVLWSSLPNDTVIDTAFGTPAASTPKHIAYDGTLEARTGHENAGNPTGADGWAFAGWGYWDGANWHYYFAYDADVDYGTTVSAYTAEAMPSTVDKNYEFRAFWKAMERTVVYSLKRYDSTYPKGSYTESTLEWPDSTTGAKPKWNGTPTTTVTVRTGKGTTLLGASDVVYDGYTLKGWTYDGLTTLQEGSTTAFLMPELAFNTSVADSILYLYPVFEVKKLTITYVVDDDSKTPTAKADRGTLAGPAGTTGNGHSDVRNTASDKIFGSTPVDKPGYEFDYWTKDTGTTKLTTAEGLQADGRTLVPSESGEYHAHFKEKKYNFQYAKSTTDANETLPTAALPVDAVWTDNVNTGTPTYNGYDFDGWDVYDITSGTRGTSPLHSGLKGTQLVSALSDAQGNATKLVLVPHWTKTQLGLTYHSGSAAGVTWSTNASDFPTKTGDATIDDPMNTGAYTAGQQEKKINAVIDDVIDLRQASSITRKGYKLVGWMDTATAGAGTNYYYFNADLDGDGTPDAGVILTSPYVLKMGATSVDLYPIWAAKGGANGYKVTFDDGVADPTDTSVTGLPTNWSGTFDGKNINVSAPSRAGYTFTGWTADPTTAVAPTVAAGATASEDYAVMAGQDDTITTIKLIANWKAATDYKVTYVVNAPAGTTYSGANVAVPADRASVAFNATDIKQTALAEADLPGYTFEGWVVTRDDTGATIATVNATTGYADAAYNTLVNNDATAKGITYTAQWKVKSGYSVTFDANAGTDTVTGLPTDWSGDWDGKGISVSAPSRAGYTFTGWTTNTTGATAPTVTAGDTTATAVYATMANGKDTITTIRLVANWDVKTGYSVTYVVNAPAGTTYSGANVAVPADRASVAFNATDIKQTALAEADLPGYTFEGWVVTRDDTGATIATVTSGYATDAVFSTLAGGDATVSGITYTAQWKVKSGYQVKFDAGTTDTVTGLPTDWSGDWDGKNINVTAPSRTGYTFTGWTTDPATAVAPAANATVADYATMANGNDTITTIKLTANWRAKDYTVTYHLGAGSWSTNTTNYPAGEPALAGSYGPADPTGAIEYATNSTVTMRTDDAVERDGYTLVGWQDDATTPTNVYYVDSAYAAANSLTYTPSFTMPAANVDLYPIWEKTIYTVTFEPATASHPGYSSVTGMPTPNPWTGGYDDTVTYAAPTLTGYTFGGWDVYETADYNANKANPTQATLLVHVGAGSDTYSALANDPSKDKLTMVAIWTAKGFGLTYVLTAGEGTWQPVHITDSGAATPQALIPHNTNDTFNLRNASTVSRPGWTLVGWKDSNSGTVAANEYRFGAGTNPAGEYEFTMPAANVYLYPIWEENDDYAVKFDGNAPTANTSDLANLPADQPVAPAKLTWEGATGFVDTHAPSFVGYKFLGWTVKGTDRVVINGTDTTPLKGAGYYFNVLAGGIDSAAHKTLTLIANWEVDNTYAVTFVDGVKSGEKIPVDTGTMPDDQTGLAYTDTVDHTKPTRRGYTFVDWTVEDITDPLHTNTIGSAADGTSAYKAIAGNPAYKTLRLTANWTPLTGYSVTFDDGVTDTSVTGLPADWSGDYIATDIDVSAPSRKGYTFAGWTTDTDGATAPAVSAGDNTAKAAYDFLATQDDTIKAVNLIANWTPITYQVTFDAGTIDAVTGLPSNWSGNFDAKNIDVSAPSRLGYIFVGWTTTTSGAVAPSVAAGATAAEAYATMAGDDADIKVIDLVATWTVMKGYNVHFVDKPVSDTGTTPVNMGTLVDILNMDWDAWFNAGPKPTRPGYTWLRWDVTDTTDPYNVVHIGTATEGSYQYCSTAINMTTGRPDDTIYDLDFTAIWQPEEHTVTYVLTSGEGSWVKANITDPGKNVPAAAVKYDVDDTVTVRQGDTVVRAGYTLVGWQDAVTAPTNVYLVDATYAAAQGATVTATFTMPANDVLLYPIWNAKAYAVYFEVNKPVGATDVLQVVSGMPADQTDLAWTDDVDTKHPTLAGYTFTGWTIKDAATTGAKRGTLTGTTYKYNDMALTDTPAHASLTLVAQWEAAPYRVIYVDSTDATGAAVTPATQIDNNANAQWDDILGIGDPASMFGYAGKSASDWQFDGWDVYDPNTNTYVRVLATDDTSYSALAARENLTVADVATATDTPALVLYAAWTRRVPFIVDYVLSDTSTVEGSDTLTGLDGDDIATTWATKVLDMGDAHKIAGYTYNRLSSTPGITGTLTAGADTLHLVLYYDPLTDYVVTYDATPGTNYAGSTTDTAKAPAWNSVDSGFAPNDADWAYKGHKIDHWTYGPTGTEYVFDAADGKTFAQIAAAIYGAAADGTQGRDLDGDGSIDKPVTLHAVWVERDDYIVKYDDNYNPTYDNGVEDKFLARTDDATFTPADRVNVVWSSDEIDPKDDTSKIVEPGVKDGEALYEIEGWNYSTDGGLTQHPADGMSFEQIANVLEAAGVWSDGDEITLYARWKEIQIQLTYTPVVVTVDGTGAFNTVVANGAGGTVTRSSETVSAVTGGTASGTTLVALGATPTAAAGYHFIGWRRVSDGTTIYVTAPLSGMSTMSLTAMATGAGFNVLPNGAIDTTTLFAASQNTSDGYWHSEDYQAMFVENDPAILHYDKNADDATGTIADVTKPYGTLLTLDSGTEDATADTTDGFHRTGYTLRGWNTKADLTGTHYDLSTADWPLPEGETTLYAEWTINDGRLIYDKNADDAYGTIADVVKPYGTAITLDSGTEDTTADTTDGFHRPHYVLVGWNTKADYSGTHYDLSEGWTMPDGTTVLYAEWQKAKYEVSGPEGTKTTLPDGGDGTKIPGGYIEGGDITEIEYGDPVPEGWIDAIPEDGKHVDHWTYTWTDEDGTVHTETADDPTKFTVKGNGTITAVFADDPVEEPETPDTPATPTDTPTAPTETPAAQVTTTAAIGTPAAHLAGAAGETIPQTSDTFDALLPLAAAGLGLLLILLAFVTRRRDDEDDADARA